MHLETEKSKFEYLEDLIHDSDWFPTYNDDRGFQILCDLLDIRNGNKISEYEMRQSFELGLSGKSGKFIMEFTQK